MGAVHEAWKATPTWGIALALHDGLCRKSHQMDGCWGLMLPYDLRQAALSDIQRDYLTMAYNLEAELGPEQALAVAELIGRKRELVPLPNLRLAAVEVPEEDAL